MNDTFSLCGKTILVTGASSGIGRRVAVCCARAGANLVLMGHSHERLLETQKMLPLETQSVRITGDLSDCGCISGWVDQAVNQLGKISGLIHAAGVYQPKPIDVTTPEDFNQAFDVMVIAGIELSRCLAMKRNRSEYGASFVFLSSVVVERGFAAHGVYAAAKGGITAAAKSMAVELAPKKIRVNCIAPGIIEDSGMFQQHAGEAEALRTCYPLGFGKTEDVADACIYLLSDASRWVTGSDLVIDGGFSIASGGVEQGRGVIGDSERTAGNAMAEPGVGWEQKIPDLVAKGIEQYMCSMPNHGDFWGYDIRRVAWMEAARDSADFATRFLREARCFEDRFELLNYALSSVQVEEGMVLEFGVFKGETIRYIAERVTQTVYGFDSFRGLPEDWDQLMPKGAFYTFGKSPSVEQGNVLFVKGWFSDTLPAFMSEHSQPCSFVHVDCDLYSSTCDVLNGLAGRIVPGTVLVFDEYFNFPGWREHEYRAFAEFCEAKQLQFEYLGYVAPSCQVAVRIVE